MSASPTWPRPYLLQVYGAAIAQGFIWIEPISEERAQSFRMAFYRLRRRSDSSNQSFITPEHHLVTVGEWSPENGGRLPIVFNKLADGTDLPRIVPGDPAEAPHIDYPQPYRPLPAAPFDMDAALKVAGETELTEADIGSYVERMKRKAKEQTND